MKLCPTCQSCYEDESLACAQPGHDPLIHERAGSRVVAHKYRLERLIASGSFGAVYECMHIELNRARAMKLLHPEFVNADPHGRFRLRREALTACSFDHPNLVRIYDFGTNVVTVSEAGSSRTYDELYIVMELSRGQNLRDFLKLSGPVPLEQCLAIGIQIAEGLAEIHAKGVVYRDLKPANTMLTFDHKGELLVKIVDFGTVKLTGQPPAVGELDLTGSMFIGSPLYAPPESCMAKPVDQRGDLYSLGLILYEMIAGRRAFNAPDFPTLLNQQAYASPPPLIGPPQPLVDLIMRALRKDPSERPQTAGEFVIAMQALERSLQKTDQKTDQTSCSVETFVAPAHYRIDNGIFGLGVEKRHDDEITLTGPVYYDNHLDFDARMPTWFTIRTALAFRSIAAVLIFMILLATPSSRTVKLQGDLEHTSSRLVMRGHEREEKARQTNRSQPLRRSAKGRRSGVRPSARSLARASDGSGKRTP
jgi:serine/threonine protein kinase